MVLNLTNETHSLEFYMCTIIGTFGIVNNILNIIISNRPKMREIITMRFFNVSLSSINILTLIFLTYLLFFAQSIGENDLISTSIFACLLIPYCGRVFAVVSAWINVLISYDRICIFRVNYSDHFLNNKKNLKIILLVMFVVACVVNIPSLLFHIETQSQPDLNINATTQVITICTASSFIQTIRDISGSSTRIIIPIVLQTIFNIILIIRLFQYRRIFDPTLKKEKRFAFTVVIFNIIYLFGELPYFVSLVFINIYGYNQTYISTNSNESAIASFVYLCCLTFVLLVSTSLLTFINYLTNKNYRKEVKEMLGIKVREET